MPSEATRYVEAALAAGLTAHDLLDAVHSHVATLDEGGDGEARGTASPSAWLGRSAIEGLPRYEDLGFLGRGGMGEVRRVRDSMLGRIVALKIINAAAATNGLSAARFLAEAQATAQLQHPGIVPVYDAGTLPDGRYWYTMKEVRGSTLDAVIRSAHAEHADASAWTLHRMVDALRQVCEAVGYAHSRGALHRDLKPQNIMVGDFGEVLVLDWGLVKMVGTVGVETDEGPVQTQRSSSGEHQTRAGRVAGTPAYMAPEQMSGRPITLDARYDVYALGAILYEIISGVCAYSGSADDIISQVRAGPPTTLRERGLGAYPSALVDACERAMARAPEDRFASASELASTLQSWLEGAEKRSRGLAELAVARQLEVDIAAAEAEAAQAWQEAEAALGASATSEEGWTHWSVHRDAAADARRLRQERERRLQAALVHAPSLPEAHEALALQHVDGIVAAFATGDRGPEVTLRSHLAAHLQHLTPERRRALEARLAARCSDELVTQRHRRGELVGRHRQVRVVANHLDDGARLVSLVGSAGVGKTRLALELGGLFRERFARVVLCDLTAARSRSDVTARLSRALGVPLRPVDPDDHLVEILAADPTLLVLDNLEQLSGVIGPLCERWLADCAALTVLTTSRTRLGLAAETVIPTLPLSVLGGVELFVRRAQSVDPRFDVTPQNGERLCALVEALDRLPLALELAAARLSMFTLDELIERLTERFSLLRPRGREEAGLEAALDWSWELLEPWGRTVLSQASVFRGGFTLAAAEAVLAVEADPDVPPMFDILDALVESSLLRRDRSDVGGTRYSMLVSVQAYARERVEAAAGARDVETRHAAYFAHLAEMGSRGASSVAASVERRAELFRELDNLVAGVAGGTAETASACALAALTVVAWRGPMSLGLTIAEQALEIPDLSAVRRRRLELELGKCLRISGRLAEARAVIAGEARAPEARQAPLPRRAKPPQEETVEDGLLETEQLWQEGARHFDAQAYGAAEQSWRAALEGYRSRQDTDGESRTLGALGLIYRNRGEHHRALEVQQQALSIAVDAGNKRLVGMHHGKLGNTHLSLAQYDEAEGHFEWSLRIAREREDVLLEAISLGQLGDASVGQERLSTALGHYRAALELARGLQHERLRGITLLRMGEVLAGLRQGEEAEEALREAIRVCDEVHPSAVGAARGCLALVLAERDQPEEAAVLIAEGESMVSAGIDTSIIFLARKGQVALLCSDAAGAAQALRRAEERMVEGNVSAESVAARAVAELRSRIASAK